ncbi:MAG: methyl-accepting chemotaxis protein [Nitrospiraceae bacterium]|nr:methyl-accepting chemotaxis protein [Nitrospiraceae bacterium]
MERTWRRRNYFIKKELQGRFIFSFFLFVIAGSFFFTVIFSLLSADTLTIVYKNYNLQLGKTPVVLLREMLRAHWIFILSGGLLVVLASMILTHRFAGPLFRFERSVERMISGDFDFVITLRKRDEAKELADSLNRFNRIMSDRLLEMRELADALGHQIEEARDTADEKKGADMDKAISLARRIQQLLGGYKLQNDR